MTNSNPTVVRQFWSHVRTKSKAVAVHVKNQAPEEKPFVVTSAGMYGAGMASIIYPPKYRQVSWEQSGQIVAQLMLFLKEKGIGKGDRVAFLSWNSPESYWADIAIQSLGAVAVSIYPNSTADQVNYILEDSNSKLVLCEDDEQMMKIESGRGILSYSMDKAFADTIDYSGALIPRGTMVGEPRDLTPNHGALSLFHEIMDSLYVDGKLNDNFLGIEPEDMAILIYTSGSLGTPKGVPQLHKTITAACHSLEGRGFDFNDKDVYLSYLPNAHIYERIDGTALCTWFGVTMAFCHTLEMADVAKEIRPTILLGVPKVWRKTKEKVDAELAKATGLKKKLIDWAMQQKDPSFKRWIADLLVFKTIRAGLGGRVRLLLSGGAPIAEDILTFFDLVGWQLLEGYGLTETAGAAFVNTPTENKVGSVGKALGCVQVKIAPMEGIDAPSGVIWLKGDTVTPGYWNLPEANEEAFEDGWFNTGDIGYVDEDGYLFITGRAKRLMKTDGGKYVPTEKVENSFDAIPLVEFAVPIGHGRPFIGALLFLSMEEASAILKKQNITVPAGVEPAEFFASNAHILGLVEAAVQEANSGLEHWETIKQYTVVPVEATVENGLMTNKRTIKTEVVTSRFEEMVEEIFTREKPS